MLQAKGNLGKLSPDYVRLLEKVSGASDDYISGVRTLEFSGFAWQGGFPLFAQKGGPYSDEEIGRYEHSIATESFPNFCHAVKNSFDLHHVDEDAILEWYGQMRATTTGQFQKLQTAEHPALVRIFEIGGQRFIFRLAAAEKNPQQPNTAGLAAGLWRIPPECSNETVEALLFPMLRVNGPISYFDQSSAQLPSSFSINVPILKDGIEALPLFGGGFACDGTGRDLKFVGASIPGATHKEADMLNLNWRGFALRNDFNEGDPNLQFGGCWPRDDKSVGRAVYGLETGFQDDGTGVRQDPGAIGFGALKGRFQHLASFIGILPTQLYDRSHLDPNNLTIFALAHAFIDLHRDGEWDFYRLQMLARNSGRSGPAQPGVPQLPASLFKLTVPPDRRPATPGNEGPDLATHG